MIIYKSYDRIYGYLHIPKTSGRYIRRKIKQYNNIVFEGWDKKIIDKYKIDLAHVPCELIYKVYNNLSDISFFTIVRNPYDRFISAFKYKTLKTPNALSDINYYIKYILQYIKFDNKFRCKYIHYYPQHKFLDCDLNISVTKYEDLHQKNILKSFGVIIDEFIYKKYDVHKHLNTESIDILNKIYEKDFNIFYSSDIL